MNLIKKTLLAGAVLASSLCMIGNAQAISLPIFEDFSNGVADWGDRTSDPFSFTPLNYVATGGSDGNGYVSTEFAFASGGGAGGSDAVLFRAHDEFGVSGSSGGAFVGNWVADAVGNVTAFVRHNAPVPVNFFARFSSPFNFPGATAIQFAPVLPNTWTQLSFDINDSNLQFVTYENSSFGGVFSNIGHLQFGVSTPAGFENNPSTFTFDLDQIRVVPEPVSTSLFSMALFIGLFVRNRSNG